eukprot:m.256164 g.256164  ORF g.256164 m.256164 type:complete len:50 (+) comp19627_c0_seq3:53-202(+)
MGASSIVPVLNTARATINFTAARLPTQHYRCATTHVIFHLTFADSETRR